MRKVSLKHMHILHKNIYTAKERTSSLRWNFEEPFDSYLRKAELKHRSKAVNEMIGVLGHDSAL